MTIKTKIWTGFAALLILMGVQAISAWWALGNTQVQTRAVVEEFQPAVAHGREFQLRLQEAVADLGYFLLTGKEDYLASYDDNFKAMESSLDELAGDEVIVRNDVLNTLPGGIRQDITRLGELREQIVAIATNPAERIPAMRFAAENLNPVINEILGLTAQMLDFELEEEATEERRQLLHAIHNTRNTINNLIVNLRGYLAFGDKLFLENARLYQEEIIKNFDAMAKFSDILTFEQEDALEQVRGLFDNYITNFKALVKLHDSERGRMDAYVVKTGIAPLVAQINEKLAVIIGGLEDKSTATSQDLLDQVETARGFIVLLLVLALVAGIVIALVISLSIIRPLDTAIAAMDDISQGDGDLVHRLDENGRDEIARLSASFNRFVEKVRDIVIRVASSTEQLGDAADRLITATASTNENVQRQKQEVDQVATAITEMSASAQEVARHSDEAARSAQSSSEQAQAGRQVLGESIEVIKSLASQLNNASSVIEQLNQESLSIGKVLDVINGIAEQTNLLALNAAIEAARAGEQGRGFAVVADEVRTLAAATQQSTLEIQETITRLQGGTSDAVSVMESSLEMVEQGVGQVTQAGAALDQIVNSVADINMKNTEIAHATDQQRAVAEEVDRNIVNISQVGEANSESSRQASETSQELSRLAQELKQLVSQFRY